MITNRVGNDLILCIVKHMKSTVLNTSRLALRRVKNVTSKVQVRNLNVHEYVSMEVMRDFDIPVPKGGMAETKEDAVKKYKDIIGS